MAQSNEQIEKRDTVRAKREKQQQVKSERLASLRTANNDEEFGWGVVDPRLIARLVNAVTAQGGGIMLSITSDGGALAITFYDNGDRERVYIPRTADMTGEFEYLISLWF